MESMRIKTTDLTKLAIMSSLICIFTYFFKVPSITGYTHLGDSMIFLAVLLLGWKKGAIAGGLGAGLADFIGGYMQWVVPTFFIKAFMAIIMGLMVEKIFPNLKYGWMVGAVTGGVFQVVAYALFKLPLFGAGYAVAGLPGDIIQTVAGLVVAFILVSALMASGNMKRLKNL